jgi:hypothetical protein
MVRTNLQEFGGDVHVLSNLQVGSNLFANDLAANVLTVAMVPSGRHIFIGDGGLSFEHRDDTQRYRRKPWWNTQFQIHSFSNRVQDATSRIRRSSPYANVGISISNTEPTGEFQFAVGSNIFVNTHASNVLTVVGAIGSDLLSSVTVVFLSNIATTLDADCGSRKHSFEYD